MLHNALLYAHVRRLVDEWATITEEVGARSPGWCRVTCDRCDWYTTGTENYMDEWAWDHMRASHVGKIQVMKRGHRDLPEGVVQITGWRVKSWFVITPNGCAHGVPTFGYALRLARGWSRFTDFDFWDPRHLPPAES